MIITICDSKTTASIDTLGAQLISMKDASGKEYIWYQTMKYAQQVLDERYFVEVYRGIIVNIRFIKNIAEEWIELEFNKQKENVPVSKRKAAEVKKLYYKRKVYI